MFNPEQGSDIWVNSHWGPRCGKFQRIWPEQKKVLVEFGDSPELVDLDNCFMNVQHAYSAAAEKKQQEAMVAMKLASEYSAKACGREKSKA